MVAPNPALNLTAPLVGEWIYRFQERLGMISEDRIAAAKSQRLAEKEANEWLAEALTYKEIDQDLPF